MKKDVLRKVLYVLLTLIVIMQFVPVEQNSGMAFTGEDITHSLQVRGEVMSLLEKACYDCHSNHTVYPWYMQIQPVGFWMQHHVDEGKRELNFSIFDTYTPKRKKHKLEEIAEQVEKGEMPMLSYAWMHHDAKLSKEQAELLVSWSSTEAAKISFADSIPNK